MQQKKWCPKCNRELQNTEIVKGYEFEKGRYVVVREENFAKVRLESTRAINLVQFTDGAAIAPIYLNDRRFDPTLSRAARGASEAVPGWGVAGAPPEV